MYLALSSDQLELTFKQYPTTSDTVFFARKETYREKAVPDDDEMSVKSNSFLIMETAE